MYKRNLLLALLGTATAAMLPMTAQAQSNWPARPIKLIVPFSPGGPVDQIARTIAPGLGKELGQTIVIDNKAGAGGSLGMDAAIKADPDGYTFGFGVPGTLTILPHVQKVPFNVKDVNYISLVARVPQVLSVGPSVKASNLKELIELARKDPGSFNYASAGNATTPHMGAELLQQETGIKMTHVPYKGAAPAITALLGGEVQVFAGDLPAILPYVSKGVKILAVHGSNRLEALPNVPTTAELGLPGVKVESNYGIVGPGGLPAQIAQRMHDAIVKVVASPEVRKQFAAQGAIGTTTTAQEYRQLMDQDFTKWGAVVKKGNITLE
jgi:tripartite-type tricarboxylate transporter receptor subunit TctC